MKLSRGDEILRHGRVSQRGRTYFVTACTQSRNTGLHLPSLAAALRHEIEACEHAGHWRVAGAVIMPDHLHLLAELTGELSLSRVIARLKAKSRALLGMTGLCWQGNFYEHRLRNADSTEDVLRYMLLNPYRAGLVTVEQAYPWFWLHPREAEWFLPNLRDSRPYPEWLR